MKARKGSKHGKTSHKTSLRTTKAKTATRRKTRPATSPSTILNKPPATVQTPRFKTCEEVEVGDVGGFGSTEELEAHEKRCGQEATEFCHACSKNLCRSHFELVHRDHNAVGGHTSVQGLTSQ